MPKTNFLRSVLYFFFFFSVLGTKLSSNRIVPCCWRYSKSFLLCVHTYCLMSITAWLDNVTLSSAQLNLFNMYLSALLSGAWLNHQLSNHQLCKFQSTVKVKGSKRHFLKHLIWKQVSWTLMLWNFGKFAIKSKICHSLPFFFYIYLFF